MTGLFGYGLSVSFMIRSGLGLGPWDAFHVGIHQLSGMSIGTATILVGLLILVGTAFMGVRPGAGTIANMILIGVFIDLLLPFTPAAADWRWGFGYYAVGILMAGLATGMYIGAGMGEGPRDGLMMGISRRTRWPVRRVRTLIEVVVLVLGWLMGGTVGIGTVFFTLGIGPAVQWGLHIFGRPDDHPRPPSPSPKIAVCPHV
ncbi:MAG TPA: hypothetical protein VFI91_05280 [Longimicrobiaceae bacterium]|nr:hypothetical protein [Longimicrobiaceae bacterium]